MKIEQQVCTWEQAKKIKELGITQTSSYFYWHFGAVSETWILINCEDSDIDANDFSAYTVAELGVMMPSGYDTMHSTMGGRRWFDLDGMDDREYYKTEAEARAAMLIYLLENNILKVDEVNNRLQK